MTFNDALPVEYHERDIMEARDAYLSMRATADLRMGVIALTEHESGRPAPEGPGDVWCAHCPERATAEVRLTSGELRAYCAKDIARLTITTPLNRIEKTWSEL